MDNIELKTNCKYIIRSWSSGLVFKIHIRELTETSILYENLDSKGQAVIREVKSKFLGKYDILEELGIVLPEFLKYFKNA